MKENIIKLDMGNSSVHTCLGSLPRVVSHKLATFCQDNKNSLEGNYCIAGGFFKSILMGQSVRDVDIFCNNLDYYESLTSYLDTLSEAGVERVGGKPTQHFSDYRIKGLSFKLQIIGGFPYQSIEELLDRFDFTICKMAYFNDEIYYHKDYFMHLALKKLVITEDTSLPYVVSSMRRMEKYIKRGFSPCNGTLLKIMEECQKTSREEQIDLLEKSYGGTLIIGID